MDRLLFVRGLRDAMALPAWIVGFSLLGIGSLARDVGQPAGAAVMTTVLVWAGPAQVIFYAGIAAGTAFPAIAIAICLSSIRFLPMTIAILPMIRKRSHGWPLQLFAAHYVAVTVWIESMRRLPTLQPDQRLPYYLGFANACIGFSAITTLVGYYLAAAVPGPMVAGLLFLTPVFFTVSLVAGARILPDWLSILLGFALTPVSTALIGRNFDLLATGLAGGTIAYLVGRMRRRPA